MSALILFVCTGNTCRSPMAEELFRLTRPPSLQWRAHSAGVAASKGAPASDGAVKVLAEIGGNLNQHRSQPVTRELLQEARLVIVMTREHGDIVLRDLPQIRDKLFLLRFFDPLAPACAPLADPFCGSLEEYRTCRETINLAMPGLLKFCQALP